MNKKIKSLSKVILFPFLFSIFNPVYSLAMEDDVTYVLLNSNQKLESKEKKISEGIKIEDFNEAFNKCFNSIVNIFNINYSYKYDSQFAQKIIVDKDFYNYFIETIENICNIKLLLYNYKSITSITLKNDIIKLFFVFTEFMTQLYSFYRVPAGKNLFKFKISFDEDDFFKKLTYWISKIQTYKSSEIEELKNLNEDEKQKFIRYCSNISNNIYNVFMLSIKSTCNNKRNLSVRVEYSKTFEVGVSDIFVQQISS